MRENEESIRAVDLIQKALFRSIQEKEFVQISISSLCEKAGVSRTTFYKHYHNTYEVLDDVLDHILSNIDTLDHEVLGLHAQTGNTKRIPLCELARRDTQVMALFQDETVAKRIVDKLIEHNMKGMICHRTLTVQEEQEMYSVFHSLAYGCLALITAYGHQDEETWTRMRKVRDGFVAAGLTHQLEAADMRRLYIRTSMQDHPLSLSAHSFLKELRLQEEVEHSDGTDLIQDALLHCKGSSLQERIHPGEKIALLIDAHENTCARFVVPVVLRALSRIGVKDEDITIVFSQGLYPPLTRKQMEERIGRSIVRHYTCISSDPQDVVDFGCTVRGTPIQITKAVAQADRRICVGHVLYSSLCGYTGGLNTLIPGCASRAVILANHKEICSTRVLPGVCKGNPIYEDFQEAAHALKVDLLVDVVTNTQNQVVFASAGDPALVHELAMRALDSRYRRIVKEEASVVVVGSSKDATLQELLLSARNVATVVQRGGTVVLVGSCRNGFGSKEFEDCLMSSSNPQTVLHELCTEFKPSAMEAGILARLCLKANVVLVSECTEEELKQTMLCHAPNVQNAVDLALSKKNGKVLVVQEGSRILPELKGNETRQRL